MRKTLAIIITALLLATLVACGGKEKRAEEISDQLQKKGSTDVLKEAAKDKYDPPSDGKLTDAQIEMYLKVREKEREIAKVAKKELEAHAESVKEKGDKSLGGMMEAMKGMGSLADFATADIRAAQELGYNTAEYTWVKGRVLEASGSALTDKLQSNMRNSIQKAYDEAKKQYETTTDENQKQMLGQMIKNYEEQMKGFEQKDVDPAVAYNRQLLSKYENALNAVTSELSKYEDKEGSAETAIHEMEQRSDSSEESQ